MFTITKQFEFSASHQLHGLPEGHKCSRRHGHNYTLEVELRSRTLNDVGFVRDYGDLAVVREWLDENWEHYDLNDWFEGYAAGGRREVLNATAENMAATAFFLLREWVPELVAVRIKEKDATMAEYRPQ